MAPRRKKQKTKHARAAADATARSITNPARERLPTELLQMIFEYLNFDELMRCTRVYRKWAACIPGDNSKLREILFLTTNVPLWKDELHIKAHNFFSKDRGDSFHMTPTLPLITTKIPKLQINPWFEDTRWNKLVYLERLRPKPTPSIRRTGCPYAFAFSSVKQLRQMATSLESSVDEGLWTDMLVCIPPVQKLELKVDIYLSSCCATLTRTLADNRGIRFKRLVDSLRSLLKEVAENLMIHKVTLRNRRIIEIFEWLGDGEDGDGTFVTFRHTSIMETEITKEGHLRKVW